MGRKVGRRAILCQGKKGLHGVISHFKCLWEVEKDKTKEVPVTIGFGNLEKVAGTEALVQRTEDRM